MVKKEASIPKLEGLQASRLEEARNLLLQKGSILKIDTINWQNYPHKALTDLYIAYTNDGLFLNYEVEDIGIYCLAQQDGADVYTDSCVEFFMQSHEGEAYINFEFNASGVCYASHHANIQEKQAFSQEEYSTIKRRAKYEYIRGYERDDNYSWYLTVFIPWTTMGYPKGQLPPSFRANFYKCGDNTTQAHYLSWSPIEEDNPAFHRPQFFGSIKLA